MTKRKFTKPTKFPAEYVDGKGNKAVILGIGPNTTFPLIGYGCDGDPYCWTIYGEVYPKQLNPLDLHDIPKRITTWHNVYYDWVDHQCSTRSDADEHHHHSVDDYITDKRLCVYRIERDEDGGNPEIFVEKVEDFKEEAE